MNKTIGILAYYWPPAGGSGVQRWLRFANHLCDLGWDVHVFTFKNPKYPIREKSSLEIINPKIKVNKIKGFEFPKFMTSPSENILFNNYYSNYSSTQSYMYDQVARKFIYTLRELFLFPDARKFLINPSYKFLKNYYRKHNLNHLITTGPPHSMHLAGMKLKKDSGIKWIADFRDPWSNFFQNKLLNELDLTIKKHEKAEADVLKNCDGVFTTSESLKSKFSIKNKNSYYVPSGFEKEIESTDHNKFRIIYAGSMKEIQNPKNLWLALHDLIKSDEKFKDLLEIILIGNIDRRVINSIEFKKIRDRKILSYMSKKQLDDEISKSQLQVVCSVNYPDSDDIVPGKFFHYLSSKKNILGISNKGSDLEKIINETKSGMSFDYDNYEDLKNYIYKCYQVFLKGVKPKKELDEKYLSINIAKKIEQIVLNI
tara:strand:- start:901 stop:2181 length:1281 start_codon:yes stop_codon:yes gene_type:complete